MDSPAKSKLQLSDNRWAAPTPPPLYDQLQTSACVEHILVVTQHIHEHAVPCRPASDTESLWLECRLRPTRTPNSTPEKPRSVTPSKISLRINLLTRSTSMNRRVALPPPAMKSQPQPTEIVNRTTPCTPPHLEHSLVVTQHIHEQAVPCWPPRQLCPQDATIWQHQPPQQCEVVLTRLVTDIHGTTGYRARHAVQHACT